jgi:hypothetical protein
LPLVAHVVLQKQGVWQRSGNLATEVRLYVGDDDFRAFGHQHPGIGGTQPRGSAGDQRDFA